MDHKPEWQLIEEIGTYAGQIKVGSSYSHYKDSTKNYTVRELVIIEGTDEVGVVYQANFHAKLIFVRPAREWVEEVEWNGTTLPRFQLA